MVEKIIEFCAKNRFLVLLGVAFALAGAVYSIQRVKLDAIPDLSEPQVIVFTEWMGRNPTLIEDQVTYPISSSLIAAPHVKDVRGFSMFGMSFIYVIFEEGTDIYWARSRVLEYMNGIRSRLPEGVNPVIGPDATGIGWIFQYSLVDKTGKHSLDELRTYQDFTLRYALGSVPGVAEVASVGGYQKQYQVIVDPNKLRAYGITLQEVADAVRDSNNDVGGRILELSQREYYVRGRGYIQDLAGLEKIALLKAGFPEGVEFAVAYDRSGLIERSITTLKHALLEEAITVSLVIILFLLHIRSSLLPIITLPVAVALSFIPMYLLDIPSTIMSLGGIAIAIGATVDAEIVMIEASHKNLEHAAPNADRHKLLAEAAKEVTPAIFFSLLIIAIAFLPVFTLPGQAGRLFKPLAYTKTAVMLISAVLSITLAPSLRDVLIRGRIFPEHKHPVSRALIGIYRPFVYVALRRPKSTIALGIFALISAIPLAMKLGHEFMPPLNEGDMLYMPITLPNISIEEAKRQLQMQDRMLRDFPEVRSVFGKVGRAETPTDPAPITMVETTVQLAPEKEWRKLHDERFYSKWPRWLQAPFRPFFADEHRITWEELTTEMNRKMQFPGWTNAWTMPIKTRVDMLTTGVRTPIGIKAFGTDLNEIERIGHELENVVAPVPGTRSVLYERNLGGLYLDIVPDRDALARYGMRVGDIERVIESAIGGTPISTTVEGRNRFSINVRYPQDLRSNIEKLRQVLVPAPVGMRQNGGMKGGAGGMKQGALSSPDLPRVMLAQNMGGMEKGNRSRPAGMLPMGPQPRSSMSDAPMSLSPMTPVPEMRKSPIGSAMPAARVGGAQQTQESEQAFVPLGQLASIKIVGGPPMVRDEAGLLVGYVYVDIDQSERDIGGYVNDAKAAVSKALASGQLRLPQGYYLKWTGQYELLEEMVARMKIVVPVTLMIIIVLLFLHFRNFMETLIVLLSVPFALVGSVWLMWALNYRISTAVWVGVIALAGLAAQTGIVMIVYIDNAYLRRKQAGKVRNLNDIIWAHMEGTVMRVRPKLMTVGTMLVGLIPLLWATGSGADVMKRIAAPMVGGLITSAFLTLEIIPVVSTYWRYEELLWEKLAELNQRMLNRLKLFRAMLGAGAAVAVALLLSRIYVSFPRAWFAGGLVLGAALFVAGTAAYLIQHPQARRIVWPAGPVTQEGI